jgi:hypothetical protein
LRASRGLEFLRFCVVGRRDFVLGLPWPLRKQDSVRARALAISGLALRSARRLYTTCYARTQSDRPQRTRPARFRGIRPVRVTSVARTPDTSNSRQSERTNSQESPGLGNRCHRCTDLFACGSSSRGLGNKCPDHSCCTVRLATASSRRLPRNRRRHDNFLERIGCPRRTCTPIHGTHKFGRWDSRCRQRKCRRRTRILPWGWMRRSVR